MQVLFNKDKALPPEQQRPNNRGVRITLWCCGQKVKRCNQLTDARACPSWADAARCLRCEVEKDHSSSECLEQASAACAAAPDAAQDAAASECEQDDMAAAIAEQRAAQEVHAAAGPWTAGPAVGQRF